MAPPITWRNIDSANFSDASRGMLASQQGINQGFDVFGKLLQQREATDAANWQQGKVNNTNAFMDELLSAQTPAELAAKQAQLTGMRQGAGAQIDAAAVRAAQDARGGVLQSRALTTQQYTDTMDEAALRIPYQTAQAKYALGDKAGGDAVMAATPGLQRYAGVLAEKQLAGENAAFAVKRAKAQAQFEDDKRPLDLADLKARTADIATNNDIAYQTLALQREKNQRERDAARATEGSGIDRALQAHADKVATNQIESGIFSGGSVNDMKGDKLLRSGLKELNFDDKATAKVMKLISLNNTLPIDGVNRQVPALAWLQAIQGNLADVKGDTGGFLGWGSKTPDPKVALDAIKERWSKDGAFKKMIADGYLAQARLNGEVGALETLTAFRNGGGQMPGGAAPTTPTPPAAPATPATDASRSILAKLDAAPTGQGAVQAQIDAAKPPVDTTFYRDAVTRAAAERAVVQNSPALAALERQQKSLIKAGKSVEANAVGEQMSSLRQQLIDGLPKPWDPAEKKKSSDNASRN